MKSCLAIVNEKKQMWTRNLWNWYSFYFEKKRKKKKEKTNLFNFIAILSYDLWLSNVFYGADNIFGSFEFILLYIRIVFILKTEKCCNHKSSWNISIWTSILYALCSQVYSLHINTYKHTLTNNSCPSKNVGIVGGRF